MNKQQPDLIGTFDSVAQESVSQDAINQNSSTNPSSSSVPPFKTNYFHDNLEDITNKNDAYRKVIFTTRVLN